MDVDESEFCKTLNHLEFESIPQYVALPHVDLLRNEERGVKRIIKAIVDDLEKPSHTDEAIEQALAGFDVEIPDWRRPDICPLSLQKIGQSLREINLYWSGRNSVWRSWSEAEGLPMLPVLEIINIIETGFEAHGTTKLQIGPDSAVRAIRYATELKADIISMSWTIKPPIEPNRALMFYAASDQGKFANRYHHRSNPSSFRIGAAAATGKTMDTVGDPDDLNFIFPGCEVVVDNWYDDVKDASLKTFEAHTGVVALIMECVRLGVVHANETPGKQQDATVAVLAGDLVRIKDRDTMKSALLSIGTDINTRNLYLEVWRLFEDKAKKLEEVRRNCDPKGQMEIIAGLARNSLRKDA
ncbi:hypothetical protein LA080_000311 [Diaporthe eres]|nr:hypothetical protein LA080_000311 [Diaporthe eres]